jgi:hypothetical protein
MDYPRTLSGNLPGDLPPISGETDWTAIHQHWISIARRLIWAGLLVLAIIAVDVVLSRVLDGQIRLVLTLGVLAVVGLLIMFAYFEWQVDILIITNKRLISLNGVGPRTVKMFMLDNLMYIYIDQPGLGRLFDYARLEVVAPGGKGEEVMQRAPHPHDLSAYIIELSRAK